MRVQPRLREPNLWRRAIYIDFEGRAKEPASFLGSFGDQGWAVDVVEQELWPAAEKGHHRGMIRASTLTNTLAELRRQCESQQCVIASWSTREIREIVTSTAISDSEKRWWQENLINATPIAKSFAKALSIQIKTRQSSFGPGENKASLASFMESTNYRVPKVHGPGHSADRLLRVRKHLRSKKQFNLLPPGAKRAWTNALGHNFHDCVGFKHVMVTLSEIYELAQVFLRTELTTDNRGKFVALMAHPILSARTVHVITGWNPGSDRPPQSENEYVNLRLRDEIAKFSDELFPALGFDPSSDHFEESWAVVGLSDRRARALGRMFRQVAVFRVRNGMQTVLSCDGTWQVSRKLASEPKHTAVQY